MAAGLGFKTFTTGEVLSAANVNGYLMQGVLVFADAAARSAAITSPQEGQYSYLKDSNSTWYYSGSAWVAAGGSPLTTKGDVYTYSTTDARLAVGANDTVLTADSTAATGLKWGTPATSVGMTVIASGTLSGAQVSITSIPSTYVNLFLVINNPYLASSNGLLQLRINSNTSSIYGRWFFQTNGSNGGDGSSVPRWNLNDGSISNLTATQTNVSASVWLWNYANTTSQKSMSYQVQDRTNTFMSLAGTGGMAGENTSAISSVEIITNATTFAGGTYTLYGVK